MIQMAKPRKTLAEMAAEASGNASGGVSCPRCGCTDLCVYATKRGVVAKFQYKQCRHCGRQMYVRSETTETIVRVVNDD